MPLGGLEHERDPIRGAGTASEPDIENAPGDDPEDLSEAEGHEDLPQPDDWAERPPEVTDKAMDEALASVRLDRRDKKRRKLLEAAAAEYGTDFVRALGAIRDPRERIVFAAEAVFARKGFAGARTQEIADLCGVNKAMIHYYFDSKEKLYHAVLDKILFDLIKLTQDTYRGNLSYPEQLEIFYRGFFDYVASHKNFSRLTTMETGSSDRYLARMVETFFKPLFDRGVDFIRRGVAAGAFRKVNPRHFLVSVYGMSMSYFSDAEFVGMLLGEDPFADRMIKERREHLLQTVFAMLGCRRP